MGSNITADTLVDAFMGKFCSELENETSSNVVFFSGAMDYSIVDLFYNYCQEITAKKLVKDKLTILLHTLGGDVTPVEKTVEIIRMVYNTVDFIVTEIAMSAGTVFCMSGDNIYMGAKSSLGPIDPQVKSPSGGYVPALGYLEQLEKIREKSINGTITPADIELLRKIDLGDINFYEQATNLTTSLLEEWLVKYKFKNWNTHGTGDNKGLPVTLQEKETRAKEIASMLGDNKLWHSHARFISINTLEEKLKLKIINYEKNTRLKQKIEEYDTICRDYIVKNRFNMFMHSSLGLNATR